MSSADTAVVRHVAEASGTAAAGSAHCACRRSTAGVANVELTYPRQLARRLIVSVNVESNGVRDRSGARFVLPVIIGN